MSLQYRIRSKSADEKWRARVRHCETSLSEFVDRWCREDADFPVRSFVAGTLFLFSPRCDPDGNDEMLQVLLRTAQGTDPAIEFNSTWPARPISEATDLIQSLSQVIERAVGTWTAKGIVALPLSCVVERLVAEIVAHQYVIFRHYETTRRDLNHWGI